MKPKIWKLQVSDLRTPTIHTEKRFEYFKHLFDTPEQDLNENDGNGVFDSETDVYSL